MNSFSINDAYKNQPVLYYYKQWLEQNLYKSPLSVEDLDSPTFLQKLSILQADGIQRDIVAHTAITYFSIQDASAAVGERIRLAANLIASSLEDGFSLMNQHLVEVNSNLVNINQGVRDLNRSVNMGLSVLSRNISQATSILRYQIEQVGNVLKAILDELKIPESQRERRYHIEEGMKYFNKGMRTGDCLYFEDALDEFTTATSIERKDFFSWYYIGMIHLYSKDHLDLGKAQAAFDSYIHYADALPERHSLFDEALMMKAECYYLGQDMSQAYLTVENIASNNMKAALRAIKYLSASGLGEKQCQAMEILQQLMQQNPYIVMQVLEDYDILRNEYIIDFLERCRTKIKKEITALVDVLDKEMKQLSKYPISSFKEEKRLDPKPILHYEEVDKELNTLKSQVLDKIDTIGLMDAIALKENILLLKMSDKIKMVGEEIEKIASDKAFLDQGDAEIQKEREYLKSQGYVDLGLPSGTLWKSKHEKGYYNYYSSRSFGNKLPMEYDWCELLNNCQWSRERSLFGVKYKVTGPNGNSIFIPVENKYFNYYLSGSISSYVDSYHDYEDVECMSCLKVCSDKKVEVCKKVKVDTACLVWLAF